MILTSSTLLLSLLALAIIIYILLSARNNILLLISSIFGFVCSGIFIFLCQKNILNIELVNDFVSKSFFKLKIDLDTEQIEVFSLLFVSLGIYFIAFPSFCLFLFKICSNFRKTIKKDRIYFMSKTFLIFFNTLLSLFVISIFITFLNIVYNMNEGFLSFIFELVKKGIELL